MPSVLRQRTRVPLSTPILDVPLAILTCAVLVGAEATVTLRGSWPLVPTFVGAGILAALIGLRLGVYGWAWNASPYDSERWVEHRDLAEVVWLYFAALTLIVSLREALPTP